MIYSVFAFLLLILLFILTTFTNISRHDVMNVRCHCTLYSRACLSLVSYTIQPFITIHTISKLVFMYTLLLLLAHTDIQTSLPIWYIMVCFLGLRLGLFASEASPFIAAAANCCSIYLISYNVLI